jgi:anti-sigma factor RsiW
MAVECERARKLIDAYVDRELAVDVSAEIERHIETCAACRALSESRHALSAHLKDPALHLAAPDGLRRRIADAIAAESPPAARRPARRQWLQLAAASVAAAVLGSGTTYLSLMNGARPSLADEIVANHVRSLLVENRVVDVPSSDEHTVKPWFNGKIDFAPPVVDLTSEGFPLLGGRLDYVGQRTVAALVYRHRQHIINLFLWPEEGSGAIGAASTGPQALQGYHVIHWSSGGMAFWAVSDLNLADLTAFGDLVRKGAAAGGGSE